MKFPIAFILTYIVISIIPIETTHANPNDHSYPLRTDLGEYFLIGEGNSINIALESTERLMRSRGKKDDIKARGDHGKSHGCYPAMVTVANDLPEAYSTGLANSKNQGQRFFSIVRLSNTDQEDVKDKRTSSLGLAVKVYLNDESAENFLFEEGPKEQDFLGNTSTTFFTKDITTMAPTLKKRADGNYIGLIFSEPKLFLKRMVWPFFHNEKSTLVYPEHTFWSLTPYTWGNRAAKYRLTPCHDFDRQRDVIDPFNQENGIELIHNDNDNENENRKKFLDNPNYQRKIIQDLLENQNLCYNLQIQLKPIDADNKTFPIEDASIFWPTEDAKYQTVAQVLVAQKTKPTKESECEVLNYTPWNGLKAQQPLGSLSRARLTIYRESTRIRKELYAERLHYQGEYDFFKKYALKTFLGFPYYLSDNGKLLMQISGERSDLLHNNLFDVGLDEHNGKIDCAKEMKDPHRTAQGICYFHGINVDVEGYEHLRDLTYMGAKGARFGKNIKPATAEETKIIKENLMEPNPFDLSRELFTRKNGMIPATTLNLLAAAWLQAQNHDWFSHGKNIPQTIEGTDVHKTRRDSTDTDRKGAHETFRNVVTHWWDASQIYGSDETTILRVRTNPLTGELLPKGQIAVDMENRRLYYDEKNLPITGFSDNWWVGLELFHSLFAMEHNSVTEELSEVYPDMSDEQLFQKARLVVSALIARIHTIEWTPALLDNPTLHIGMRANWYGLREPMNLFQRGLVQTIRAAIYIFSPDYSKELGFALNSIVGKGSLDLYKVPFSLTEEFVSVYRMHPLIPDDLLLYNTQGQVEAHIPIEDTTFEKAKDIPYQSNQSTLSLMYSMGLGHPGALTLHNYPSFMHNMIAKRNTEGQEETTLNLAAIDLIRDRERGVVRYNDFRRALNLTPIETFADLTDNAEDIVLLEKLYGEDVEKLDLLVGTLAENDRYDGFAFGNTPFYIFALMASRRLMADPFYSDYFNPDVYTKVGYDWVQSQSMIDVILRHYPELQDSFKGVTNAFQPWKPVNLQGNLRNDGETQ